MVRCSWSDGSSTSRAASVVLPVALAGVATDVRGREPGHGDRPRLWSLWRRQSPPRPVLLTLFGPTGSRAPAFAAAAVAAIIAFVYGRRRWRDLPTAGPAQRAAVLITAVWAFGIVVITAGLIGFQGGSADGARVGLVIVGTASSSARACSSSAGDVGRPARRCRSSVDPSRSPCSSGSSSPTPRPRPSSRSRSTSSWSSATGRSCR